MLLFAPAAWAYGEAVHRAISESALSLATPEEAAAPVDPAGPARIRAVLDSVARANPALADQWARRWPTPESFDARAQKELLLFSREATVWGIDRVDVTATTVLGVIADASRQPDDDFRNRERLAHDDAGNSLPGVPADPALLNMGRLGALSSQAHAHYGLRQVEFSEDPEVLKADPPRFAVAAGYPKGPILTLAAEMAQEHTDLAILAALDGQPTLAAMYLGQGFHYLEDVCNPIHTVQVGLYDFFFDAFLARMKMSALSGGGYFGNLRSLASIGIDILSSHHTLSENYTQKRLLENESEESIALKKAMLEGDEALQADLDGLGGEKEFAMAAVRKVIDRSAPDGGPMYAATRAVASPELRKEGVTFDDTKDDPDAFVVREAPGWDEFWRLQEVSFRRAGTALRGVKSRYDREVAAALQTPEATEALRTEVATRLVARQLKLLGEADARLADYRADPPVSVTRPERMPGMLGAELGVVGVIAGVVLWRRRRAQG